MPDREALRGRGDAGGERVRAFRRAFDDQPAGGRASLPGGNECGEDGVVHGLVEVRVAQHQSGILPAHLQREELRLPQAGALDGLSHRPTPGEQDSVDVRVRRQRGTHRARPLDQVEHARRDARFRQAARV